MKKFVAALTLLLCLHGSAAAQDCQIGAFGDPEGTRSCVEPFDGVIFSVYVVIFVENTVAAAAYSMTYPSGMFLQARFSGPSGDGLVIDEPTGTNVALTECVIGFGGNPVLVDEYQFVAFPGFGGFLQIGPNASQNPEWPVYVNCNDTTNECAIGPDLRFGQCEFPTQERSFSTIKSLFTN